MRAFSHTPVLLEECLLSLNIREGGTYVDGTLGGGGHSEAILKAGGRVIGIDRDADAIRAAGERLLHFAPRFRAVHGDYTDIEGILRRMGTAPVDGVLLDLGVSSYQLDTPERGFSYHGDAPLDMRMDRTQALDARAVLNEYPQEAIANILREYGEERYAARVARNIVRRRPLETTQDLVKAVDASIPPAVRARQEGHPAKRTFQAVRIEVNGELSRLDAALTAAMMSVRPGGRLAVITFHSLEDRIVKNAFRKMDNPCTCPPGFPVCVCGKKPTARVVTRRPIEPAEREIEKNPRARSA